MKILIADDELVSRKKMEKIPQHYGTSHADHETVITSIAAGCDAYIKKPFTLVHVFQKLTKMGLDTSVETSLIIRGDG